MMTTPLKALVRRLHADLEGDRRGPHVKQLLADYVAQHDDWQRYALFDPERYARNLVVTEDLFELIVICWNRGQTSPIHNHEGQHCWMAVLEGSLEEARYAPPEREGAPLVPTGVTSYTLGTVGYIHDDLGLHAIRPAGKDQGISLHLYSLPFEVCNLYSPDTGQVTRTRLGFHSVGSVPVDA